MPFFAIKNNEKDPFLTQIHQIYQQKAICFCYHFVVEFCPILPTIIKEIEKNILTSESELSIELLFFYSYLSNLGFLVFCGPAFEGCTMGYHKIYSNTTNLGHQVLEGATSVSLSVAHGATKRMRNVTSHLGLQPPLLGDKFHTLLQYHTLKKIILKNSFSSVTYLISQFVEGLFEKAKLYRGGETG